MFKLIKYELIKIWFNKTFLVSLIALFLINGVLLWNSTRANNIPSSSYKELGEALSSLSIEEKYTLISEHYTTIESLSKVYTIEKLIATGNYSFDDLSEDDITLYNDYIVQYNNNNYLQYTDNLLNEFRFVTQIKYEIEQILNHEQFLHSINEKADLFSSVGIFSNSSEFTSLNINKTQNDYAHLSNLQLDYYPQKGLYRSINFRQSDAIGLLAVIFLTFVLVRQEKDDGMFFLIRSTASGRSKTAIIKIFAMSISSLMIVVILYLSNILLCNTIYDIGPLNRAIQSNAFLVKSVFSLNVGEYLILFLCIKWMALTVIGAWVLLAAQMTRKAVNGYVLALSFPLISEFVRISISGIDRKLLLRYTSIASFMQTNEILGSYRNLNIFETPINFIHIEIVAAIIYFLSFSVSFVYIYSSSSQKTTSTSSFITFNRKKYHSSLLAHESYKSLVANGGIAIILLAILLQCYLGFSSEAFITPEEVYYKNYMDVLEGNLTKDKINYLNEEFENLRPLFELDYLYTNGLISEDQYSASMMKYMNLRGRYQVFSGIYNSIRYSDKPYDIGFIYHQRYPKFFGADTNDNHIEYLLICICLAILISPVLAYEHDSGMFIINATTPKGKKQLLYAKYYYTFIISVLIACVSYISKFIYMLRYDGFSAVWLPIMTLPEFSNTNIRLPIFVFVFLMLLIRILVCISLSIAIISLSSIINKSIVSTVASLVLLCLSSFLVYLRIEQAKWISLYPLVNAPTLLTENSTPMLIWVYLMFSSIYSVLLFLLNTFIPEYEE